MPTTVRDLIHAVESVAPPALAEPWDNVGLILGDPGATLSGSVHLAIDLTDAVVEGALAAKAGAILAYHPPIFQPIRRLTPSGGPSRALLAAARAGIAVYSPHTALDACAGGVADWLLDAALGEGAAHERRAIAPATAPSDSATHKLVTFVPAEPAGLIDRLRAALSAAGAGRIGAYDQCSFTTPGTGSFLGGEGSNPAVGRAGRLETVDELRLEMVCPAGAIDAVVAALRANHPYEEPAFDLYPLAGAPDLSLGAGRIASLARPEPAAAIAARLKVALAVSHASIASPRSPRPITRVAVCPGSGASLLDPAIALGATLFITGEMKHHEVLGAIDRGCAVLLAGHTETERPYLGVFAQRLAKAMPGMMFQASPADRSPLAPI